MNLNGIIGSLKSSRLARDSFWAVFGNGLGYGLLLLAGIVIARFLGRDVYGEYGLVKTTMIYIAGFATLGLGISSTKYIANALHADRSHVRSLARDAVSITLVFSTMLAAGLAAVANPLAAFLGESGLVGAFRALAVIIVFKALNTTQNGVLAGFGDFREIARNSVASGALMLVACVPLTYFFGLTGAFISLAASQGCNALLNYLSIRKRTASLTDQQSGSHKRELIAFSFPIALQELNYTICSWGGIILLTKLSSVGQVAIYTTSLQWNGVITFIPGLLNNVILSHLSGSQGNNSVHRHTLKTMLGVNFLSTVIPFVFVLLLSGVITSFYGATFKELRPVLCITTSATIFSACSNVFYSELIATGHNWISFLCRFLQEATLIIVAWILLTVDTGISGAMATGIAYLTSAIVSFLAPFTSTIICKRVKGQ